MQNASKFVYLLSSAASRGNEFYVNQMNLWKAAVMIAAEKVIPHIWFNDRDQFLQPNCELPEEFKNDCLIWMLFNGSNLTASANDLEWNNKKWSIVNHFIPYTEEEVGSSERFESDFMVRYMEGKIFSTEAQRVLDEGWYQIRMVIKAQNETGLQKPISFSAFESAYKTLTEKLRPKVYEYGFLK